MNKIRFIQLALCFLFSGQMLFAQETSVSFKVWGNCGMCKKTIEGAALKSGAASAGWNSTSKMLTVVYDASSSKVEKIQKAIADAGYDNDGFVASDDAYNKLHGCCQYDRKNASAGNEVKTCCMKEGKCEGDKKCCKKKKSMKECCTKGSCGANDGCCAPDKMKKEGCCKKSSAKKCEQKCSGHQH